MTEPGVDSGDRLAAPPVHHSEPASSPAPATKTTRIRFLDQLSPDAQKAYHDEQERRREEKKNKIEEVGESETRIERVEQPPASMLASQTAENTQYNRQHTRDTAVVSSAPGGEAEGLTNGHQEQEPGPGPPQPAQGPSEPGAQAPRFVDIQTRYREQELIIQSRLYQGQGMGGDVNNGGGGGYQNPVFDMTMETPGQHHPQAGDQGWSRPHPKERRPGRRWSFRRTNSWRNEHSGRVQPIPSPSRMAGMSDAHAQYEYIQLQQEQKINWTRTFTIEQQLRYGITPTGEPLDVAMLKEIQMHHNFQIDSSQLPQSIDNISIQSLSIQDPGNNSLGPNLNLDYAQQPQPQGGPGAATVLTAGAALNGGAALLNGGAGVANGAGVPSLGGQDENSNHDYSSVPMAGLPMIGALMGMCIGGPIGMLAGVKIGGFSAVMGSILGYTSASVVKEHNDFREYIDGHYEEQPELFVQSPASDSLNKRRTSRSLPEVPGQRPLSSAKYMVGPNGYRRPSLVRAASFTEHRNVNVKVNMTRAASVERGQRPDYTSRLEGGHRKLPSRPFTRMGSFENRGESQVPRRVPLLRNNSNLHRKMSYRQQAAERAQTVDSFHYNAHSSAASHHRSFRRYGDGRTEAERRAVLALIARERERGAQRHADQAPDSYNIHSDTQADRTEGKLGCDRRSRWSGHENGYMSAHGGGGGGGGHKPRYQPRIHGNNTLYH